MHGKFILSSLAVVIFLVGLARPISAQSEKEFTVVTGLVAQGANIWLPSTMIVKKGDAVKLNLRNVTKKEHGFSIDELNVKEVIRPGETKEVSIKPDSAGIYRYYCQLHGGHVGGQLLVQE